MTQTNPRRVADHQAIAVAHDLKGSPQKAQLVMRLIRGKPVERALNDLSFCRQRFAELARKVLQSAIANAENNHQLNVDKLVVTRATAGKATVIKRFHARARGRPGPILKPRTHLTIVVGEAQPKASPAKKAAPKPAKAEAKSAAPRAAKKPAAPKAAQPESAKENA
jgi:large subunit ribosomal protein L22